MKIKVPDNFRPSDHGVKLPIFVTDEATGEVIYRYGEKVVD